ncbi:AtpZ/AtpI family protein [Patescibacteria group bacterium]|nr:AtpZ/AtpI family protein [Patescibacteria group bacterium]
MIFDFKNSQDKDLWRLGLTAFAQMSGLIAMPVLIALFVGRFLDQKYNTGYLYFFSLTALAFVISCVGIGVIGMKYLKQVNKEDNKLVNNKESSDHDQRR